MRSHARCRVESSSGRVLEHLDEFAAFSQLHPGAVYLGPGVPEQVQHLGIIEEVDTYLGE